MNLARQTHTQLVFEGSGARESIPLLIESIMLSQTWILPTIIVESQSHGNAKGAPDELAVDVAAGAGRVSVPLAC